MILMYFWLTLDINIQNLYYKNDMKSHSKTPCPSIPVLRTNGGCCIAKREKEEEEKEEEERSFLPFHAAYIPTYERSVKVSPACLR